MNRLMISAAAVATIAFGADVQAQGRDQIRIVGSSTVFPFTTAVAEAFGRESGLKTPVVESTGTGGGFELFCGGVGAQHPDFTNASRQIEQEEIDSCRQNGVTSVTEVKIGYDGIVLANSNNGPEMSVTIPQLWMALARQVPQNGQMVDNPHRSWNQIDPSLPDQPIEVLGPPPTSGTRDAFVELVMEVGCEEFPEVEALGEDEKETACTTIREDGAFIDAGENDNLIVQRLGANNQAFGIFGYSFLDANSDQLQGAQIGGVEPTYENIASGDYPVSRSLFVYVKNQHMDVIPGMREFISEYTDESTFSDEGYLADRGLIALPEAEREQVRNAAHSRAQVAL